VLAAFDAIPGCPLGPAAGDPGRLGEKVTAPFTYSEWDVKCPRNHVVAGVFVGNGAHDPSYTGSYGARW
jgi:hypothetical protein